MTPLWVCTCSKTEHVMFGFSNCSLVLIPSWSWSKVLTNCDLDSVLILRIQSWFTPVSVMTRSEIVLSWQLNWAHRVILNNLEAIHFNGLRLCTVFIVSEWWYQNSSGFCHCGHMTSSVQRAAVLPQPDTLSLYGTVCSSPLRLSFVILFLFSLLPAPAGRPQPLLNQHLAHGQPCQPQTPRTIDESLETFTKLQVIP